MPTLRLDSFIRDHDRVPVLARCRKSRLGGAAPTPNPNRLNCPRRKWTTVSPSTAPPGRLRLNHSQALAQNPAESRELPRRFALGSTSLWKRRLDGGPGQNRTVDTLIFRSRIDFHWCLKSSKIASTTAIRRQIRKMTPGAGLIGPSRSAIGVSPSIHARIVGTPRGRSSASTSPSTSPV
jgi:hypothetical protein